MRKTLFLLAAAMFALALAPAGLAKGAPKPKPPNLSQVKLLAFNDFHGHLEANTPGSIVDPATGLAVPAGGAEYFATHMKALGSQNANTYVVGAGDMIGGTPLLSGLFHDEPTIEFLNSIGVDTVGVGNHEFDEGLAELLRMQYGNRSNRGGGNSGRAVHAGPRGRLSSRRRLPGRDAVLRLGLPVPRGERRQGRHGRPDPAAVPDRQDRDRRADRLHRRDVREHAAGRHAVGRRRAGLPRRGRHGQRARAEAEGEGDRDDDPAAAPGRLPERALLARASRT